MNSGAFDEAAFDFLVSDEGGANVAADRARSAAKAAGAEPARDRIDASANVQHRLDEVRAAANPLLEAATPLLRMLADMPATLDTSEAVASLRTLLVREVALFQNLCEKADLPWKHMAVVRYCLCTALDEAANRTRWGGGGVWASQSLLITYEGEVDGGEKFFLLIGRMATDPQEYVDILEILYRVLGLGFEGRYSVVADGRAGISSRFASVCGRSSPARATRFSRNCRCAGAERSRAGFRCCAACPHGRAVRSSSCCCSVSSRSISIGCSPNAMRSRRASWRSRRTSRRRHRSVCACRSCSRTKLRVVY
ncbi:type IV/VI secretion system, DotU family domain protein [Burkholderia pseudomallei MSHR684]|nr:type IV/VI secretion system, DotU family domain protein [Burkholderia pseudomallei MSHR684]